MRSINVSREKYQVKDKYSSHALCRTKELMIMDIAILGWL